MVNSCNYKMARIYTQTGDYSTAYEMFTSLLLQDPYNSSLMSSLAYVCGKKGDYEEAVKLYENILQKYTYDTVSMKNLIMIYNHMGKKDKALRRFVLPDAFGPKHANIFVTRSPFSVVTYASVQGDFLFTMKLTAFSSLKE